MFFDWTKKENQQLMGVEWSVAKIFFQNYFQSLGWQKRLPRTKFDITNTLLDIGYTYLFNIIDAHLRLYGFDTYKGVYHQEFYLRKSLVCDLVEPFRCIVDKQLLKSFNLGQIDKEDFKVKGDQYLLQYKKTNKYTRLFFEAILARKEDIFLYIQKYYRCVIRNDYSDFPVFNI